MNHDKCFLGYLISCCGDEHIVDWSQRNNLGGWLNHHYCKKCGSHSHNQKIYTKEAWMIYLKGAKNG